MPKFHRKNRIVEREGVNAVCAFFESQSCIFQEISLGNDYGKDAFVDLGNELEATSVCAALQIKSGTSYRRDGNYQIPMRDEDREYWSSSTVPIIGLVYDPTDRIIRWVNITTYLCRNFDQPKSYIPVNATNVLNPKSLRSDFFESVRNSVTSIHKHPLVQLCDESIDVQMLAVRDCFILGRSEPRIFIGLRRMLFQLAPEVVAFGIYVLTHLTHHPDIFWTENNWITSEVRDRVFPHLNWSIDEVVQLLTTADLEQWCRGQLGQHIYMLLVQDLDIDEKLLKAVECLCEEKYQFAVLTLQILVSRAGEDGITCLAKVLAKVPMLREDPLVKDMNQILSDFGSIEIW